jgi:hypothetical protein
MACGLTFNLRPYLFKFSAASRRQTLKVLKSIPIGSLPILLSPLGGSVDSRAPLCSITITINDLEGCLHLYFSSFLACGLTGPTHRHDRL